MFDSLLTPEGGRNVGEVQSDDDTARSDSGSENTKELTVGVVAVVLRSFHPTFLSISMTVTHNNGSNSLSLRLVPHRLIFLMIDYG